MKKSTTSLVVLLVILSFNTLAQEADIRIEKAFGGVKFYQGTTLLKPKEVMNLMADSPEALEAFKKAKSNYDAGQVIGFIGGFMIGWPIGTALAGGEAQWGLAAGGVGVLLLAIPLNSAFNKHSKNAVEIYNRGSGSARSGPQSIYFFPNGTGGKVIIRL